MANTIKRSKKFSTFVSWSVSNCKTDSERERFVEELQQFVSVDVYGDCGPLEVCGDRSLDIFRCTSEVFAAFQYCISSAKNAH